MHRQDPRKPIGSDEEGENGEGSQIQSERGEGRGKNKESLNQTGREKQKNRNARGEEEEEGGDTIVNPTPPTTTTTADDTNEEDASPPVAGHSRTPKNQNAGHQRRCLFRARPPYAKKSERRPPTKSHKMEGYRVVCVIAVVSVLIFFPESAAAVKKLLPESAEVDGVVDLVVYLAFLSRKMGADWDENEQPIGEEPIGCDQRGEEHAWLVNGEPEIKPLVTGGGAISLTEDDAIEKILAVRDINTIDVVDTIFEQNVNLDGKR
ncbi:hypothetical protein RHSIM_Rhsim06G0099500 [Rhododendron simsii]|uniref:Uncharacterized protein n=1 Tax=Rhododendron simsii TaxID=118357 RepID=A0A834LKZ9_RHOSS|nr:hypothetical protein RHSIM_Rhsim06G0099500 [Rhododendron simsii]